MEEKLLAALAAARERAAALGVRIRPVADLKTAKRCLASHKESDGFWALVEKGHLEYSLEALAVKKEFTGLFSDEEANTALTRLLDAGYRF